MPSGTTLIHMKRREIRERDAEDAREQADRRRRELLARLRGSESVVGDAPPDAESSPTRPEASDEPTATDSES